MSERQAWRIVAAYRKEGATAHGPAQDKRHPAPAIAIAGCPCLIRRSVAIR